MLGQPTRLVYALHRRGLLLQGSTTLLARLYPPFDQAFPLLLEMTRLIPTHSLLHIGTALIAFWLYFWGGPRGPFRFALSSACFISARGRRARHGTSARPRPASVRPPLPLLHRRSRAACGGDRVFLARRAPARVALRCDTEIQAPVDRAAAAATACAKHGEQPDVDQEIQSATLLHCTPPAKRTSWNTMRTATGSASRWPAWRAASRFPRPSKPAGVRPA